MIMPTGKAMNTIMMTAICTTMPNDPGYM